MIDYIFQRAEKLRASMKAEGADAFVVVADENTNWESLYYVSGFRGTSGAIIIYNDSAELILDSRYVGQGHIQSPYPITEQKCNLIEDIRNSLYRHSVTHVLCEGAKTFHSTWNKLSAQNNGVKWFDGTSQMVTLRRTKDPKEVEFIKKAGYGASSAFLEALSNFKSGMTEKEFEALLNYSINKSGCEAGFEMIVASGPRSAMPHGRASDKEIVLGEWVTVDFGARYMGYFCDITRNFSIGAPDEKAAEYHEILVNAHEKSADTICAGINGTDVHKTALDVLDSSGIGEYFTHGLGHGIGLEIHELPSLSSRSKDTLKAGDIVTVEPGVYIDGWGGLRLEDDYLVTETGSERLTNKLNQCFYRL